MRPPSMQIGSMREGVMSAGLRTSYTNKTFYSVGLLLPPNSSEFLDATAQSTW